MANLLYQQIEMLGGEKHIEPEVVVSAIEDAMVVAARKYYKTEEDLRAKFNQETGQVDVFSVHMVVEEVTDPKKEISLAEAKKKNPGGGSGEGNPGGKTAGGVWAHGGAGGEESDSAEGARGGARHDFQRV